MYNVREFIYKYKSFISSLKFLKQENWNEKANGQDKEIKNGKHTWLKMSSKYPL